MNYSRAIFLISEAARAVNITYEEGETAARTMFKTLDPDIKVDDFVVIPTESRHKMTVCKVVEVDVEPDLESDKDLNWIVGVVSRANFEEIRDQEADAINKIKGAERRRKREELRKTLLADVEDDVKALPIYTAHQEPESK